RLASAKLLEKLATVESRHLVVAENRVGRLVDHLEQCVSSVGSENHVAVGLHALLDQVANQRIIICDKQLAALSGECGCSGHRAGLLESAAARLELAARR